MTAVATQLWTCMLRSTTLSSFSEDIRFFSFDSISSVATSIGVRMISLVASFTIFILVLMKGKKFSTVTMVFLLYWDSKLPWDFPSIVKGVAKINLFRFLFASYLVKVWSMHSKMDLLNASKILWQNIILSSFKVNQYRWVEWRFPPEPFSCLYKALLLVQKIQVLYKVLRYQGIRVSRYRDAFVLQTYRSYRSRARRM